MKRSLFLKFAALTLIAVVGSTGCATKKPKSPTPLYGARTSIDNTAGPNTLTNIPQPIRLSK